MTGALAPILRRFEAPDEVRTFAKGRFELVRIGGTTIGRATYEPGWKWSVDVGAEMGTVSCHVEHVGLVVSGCATAAMDDGTIYEMRAGDLFYIPPGHDSWVVGDAPYVLAPFHGRGRLCGQGLMRAGVRGARAMNRILSLLVACCVFSLTAPGKANILVEATFEQKMARAQLVIIGTVTAVHPGGPGRQGSRATLDVLRTLKGEAGASLTVSTYSRIAEDNLRCCDVGATYIMFLGGRTPDGHMVSVWGQYGMIRIGGPPNQIRVIRSTEGDGTTP